MFLLKCSMCIGKRALLKSKKLGDFDRKWFDRKQVPIPSDCNRFNWL